MREVFLKAHQMTREIKRQYQEVDYRAQFGLCLSYLLKNRKEEKEMTIREGNMRRLVIADWWLRKNPAQDVIIHEFEDIEITKETEKAYQLNGKVWVPKSVCKWKEVTLEDKVLAITTKAGIKVWLACKRYASQKLKEIGEPELLAGMRTNPKLYEYMAEKLREDGYEL